MKGVFMSVREEFEFRILEDFRQGRITRNQAAVLLGVNWRTITRKVAKVRARGLAGVKHGNCKKIPSNKTNEGFKIQMLEFAEKLYHDFNMTHCLEMIESRHGLRVGYTTFRNWCRTKGLGKRKKRRPPKHRLHRERFSNEGLLLQMDGSHHKWNGKEEWCLIAMIDDATSDIPYAEFFPGETTWACMKVLRHVIEKRGVPEAIYTDRAGWAGGSKRQNFSQFQRACEELGIRIIYANSPEAKGRIERAWRTFQDRLIPELRLNNIDSMEKSNEYLENIFLKEYWQKRNTVSAKNQISRYQALPEWVSLKEVLCLKHSRIVRNDHTITWNNRWYKILGKVVGSISGKEISIHEYENGRWQLFYGHRALQFKEVINPLRTPYRQSA